MTNRLRVRTPTRRSRASGRLVGLAAAIAVTGCQPSASPTGFTSPSTSPRSPASGALGEAPELPPLDDGSGLGEADGAVPPGTTAFDNRPAVAKLDPDLLHALRQAATAARGDGVELVVNGGWRSPAYEQHLRQEAVGKYGSEAEAARWVATANTSAHVTGDAVDIGPPRADTWLAQHGARYGLCQIYRNEPWHYELRPKAVERGCPAMYADPTRDPRMQQ